MMPLYRIFYIVQAILYKGIHSLIAQGCLDNDRDINAAVNLKNMAVSSTVSASGEEGSGLGLTTNAKPASVKREFNSEVCSGMSNYA
jgi:hypothetical protein